jgi:antirestriction protein
MFDDDDEAMLEAFKEVYNDDVTIEQAKECFVGQYSNSRDFVRDYLEQIDPNFLNLADRHLVIDWDATARAFEHENDIVESDGFYFDLGRM